ncbi:MAG: YigZ family protein [Bacteroidota bacterium]
MIQHYKTIAASSEGLYKEKGSKFLAFAHPVRSEQDIKERLEESRKVYYDARHHCYAYVLTPSRTVFRANDDGEPNHSAGDPILGQIKAKELTDVLVIVVRYFGGTKLGVSGLINAYRTASEEALNKGEILTIEIKENALIQYGYEDTNEVMRLVNDLDLEIADQKFEATCEMSVKVKVNFKKALTEKIVLLQQLGHSVKLQFED